MIIFSAPSGAGKTTIVKEVIKIFPQLEFSVSACSRPKRENERDGLDYHFLTEKEFKNKIDNNEFVEWEEVYPGNYYGTLKSELKKIWNKNKHVIFDVDVIGGLNIKKKYPENALAIFIKPPDLATLERRLKKRGTDNKDSIKKRLEKAAFELSFEPRFDAIIVNDYIDKAVKEVYMLIQNFLNN